MRVNLQQLADGAIADGSDQAARRLVPSQAEPGHNREFLPAGRRAGRSHFMGSRQVDRGRLLAEEVLARPDGGRDVQWADVRRSREQNDVHAGLEHVEIGPLTDKALLRRTGKLSRRIAGEHVGGRGDLIGKSIAERHDPHGRIGGSRLQCGPRAAATAADEPDADSLGAMGKETTGSQPGGRRAQPQRRSEGRAGHRTEKSAARMPVAGACRLRLCVLQVCHRGAEPSMPGSLTKCGFRPTRLPRPTFRRDGQRSRAMNFRSGSSSAAGGAPNASVKSWRRLSGESAANGSRCESFCR